MTSLLEMIDARIAELKRMWSGGANDCILSTIHELEQVRQKVVEIAQELEELVKVTDNVGYFAQHFAYRRALAQLIGQDG